MLRSKEFALNFASSSTKLQQNPPNAKGGLCEQALSQARTTEWFKRFKEAGNLWMMINILVDHLSTIGGKMDRQRC